MNEADPWDKGANGELLVSTLTAVSTAFAPDASIAYLRLGFADERPGVLAAALQLAIRPSHIAELIAALVALKHQMDEIDRAPASQH